MPTRFRQPAPARWPFWLLLAAWLCANSPQAATGALIAWLGEARHFSHQQRLTAEVAFVLVGQKAPGLLAAVNEAPRPAPLPTIPAELELKKLDLAVERTVEELRPAARENNFVMSARAWPEARREPPPHEPPRAAAMS